MTSPLNATASTRHKVLNLTHSVLLMGGMGLVVMVAAALLWGASGAVIACLAVAALWLLGPRIPPQAIMRLYRARAVKDGQLIGILDELSERANLPRRPDLYIVPSLMLNAFATGTPGQSAIAVTEGLMRRLTTREIAGVLAHEISHIENNDLWIMGLADVMTRFVQALSYVALALAAFNLLGILTGDATFSWTAIVLLYFAPAISSLLQLGLSRTREFDADLDAARLTGDPMGLASALSRLERYTGQVWEDLAFPVPGRHVPQPSLLRTHPPTEERLARLRALQPEPGIRPIVVAESPMISLIGVGPIEMRPRFRFPGVWF